MDFTLDYVLDLGEDEKTKCCECNKTWKFSKAEDVWYSITGRIHYCPFCGHPQRYEVEDWDEAREDFAELLRAVALAVKTKSDSIKSFEGRVAILEDEVAALKRSRTALVSVNTRFKNKLDRIQDYFGITVDDCD